jgi:hypothetical protein
MKKSILRMISLAMIALFAVSQTAFADEAQLMSMVSEMQKQMTDLQKTVAMQKSEISALKTQGPKITMAPGGVEAAPAMSEEDFTKQFDKNLKGKIGESDKWLKDLKFKGDLRLRYEAFANKGNSGATTERADRNRFRFRLRYGFEKKFSDDFKVGFRMATGSTSDPTSTNQTMTADFGYKGIFIDQAYATYTPNWANVGPISGAEVTAGKFKNPFEEGSSDLVWDRDVTPEGIYEKFNIKLLKTDNLDLGSYVTAGQFVLQENSNHSVTASDASLFAVQFGLEPALQTSLSDKPIKLKSAVSFYGYDNYANNNNWQGWGTNDKGNPQVPTDTTELAARQFQLLEVYNELKFNVKGVPVSPYVDWVTNLGNHANQYTVPGSYDSHAWALGIKLGKLDKKGSWETSYAYKYIGRNSVTGFADSDFNGDDDHVGKRGSVIKAGYGLTDYLSLNAAAFFVQNLNAPYTTGLAANQVYKLDQKRFQLDLSWKF